MTVSLEILTAYSLSVKSLVYSRNSAASLIYVSILQIIGKVPYTSRNRGEQPHGYGKVGARKLITGLWSALGLKLSDIDILLQNHWANTDYNGVPHVCWTAPLPVNQ
ncbi:hypothetical protein A2154_04690 [Candidatus Gottesmanbacteria bacterium RBG_16_43_7]|uniref:Uncharacterized protein n=1 Tax=Candidatus Gottesmanbacteria bacterium RBG_16_43_7 TaxID=1798373 RepID=A0A1F5Z7Z6_9BACT|nr:MAG: hypothetical protein A2154_04690 [Candidatus Gottesmanbacteria bacterium RBG_16_43_7]